MGISSNVGLSELVTTKSTGQLRTFTDAVKKILTVNTLSVTIVGRLEHKFVAKKFAIQRSATMRSVPNGGPWTKKKIPPNPGKIDHGSGSLLLAKNPLTMNSILSSRNLRMKL